MNSNFLFYSFSISCTFSVTINNNILLLLLSIIIIISAGNIIFRNSYILYGISLSIIVAVAIIDYSLKNFCMSFFSMETSCGNITT
jgi:hypothetical protein